MHGGGCHHKFVVTNAGFCLDYYYRVPDAKFNAATIFQTEPNNQCCHQMVIQSALRTRFKKMRGLRREDDGSYWKLKYTARLPFCVKSDLFNRIGEKVQAPAFVCTEKGYKVAMIWLHKKNPSEKKKVLAVTGVACIPSSLYSQFSGFDDVTIEYIGDDEHLNGGRNANDQGRKSQHRMDDDSLLKSRQAQTSQMVEQFNKTRHSKVDKAQSTYNEMFTNHQVEANQKDNMIPVLENEVQTLKEDLDKLTSSLNETRTEAERLRTDNFAKENAVKELELKCSNLERDIEQAKMDMSNSNMEHSKTQQKLSKALGSANNLASSYSSTIEDLKKSVAHLKTEKTAVETEKTAVETEKTEVEQRLAKFEKEKTAELESKEKEIERIKECMVNLAAVAEKGNPRTLRRARADRQSECNVNIHDQMIAEATKNVKVLLNDNLQAQEELLKANNELKQTKEKLSSTEQELLKVTQMVKKLQADNSLEATKVLQLQQDYSTLDKAKNQAEQNLSTSINNHSKTKEKLSKTKEQLSEAIERANKLDQDKSKLASEVEGLKQSNSLLVHSKKLLDDKEKEKKSEAYQLVVSYNQQAVGGMKADELGARLDAISGQSIPEDGMSIALMVAKKYRDLYQQSIEEAKFSKPIEDGSKQKLIEQNENLFKRLKLSEENCINLNHEIEQLKKTNERLENDRNDANNTLAKLVLKEKDLLDQISQLQVESEMNLKEQQTIWQSTEENLRSQLNASQLMRNEFESKTKRLDAELKSIKEAMDQRTTVSSATSVVSSDSDASARSLRFALREEKNKVKKLLETLEDERKQHQGADDTIKMKDEIIEQKGTIIDNLRKELDREKTVRENKEEIVRKLMEEQTNNQKLIQQLHNNLSNELEESRKLREALENPPQ